MQQKRATSGRSVDERERRKEERETRGGGELFSFSVNGSRSLKHTSKKREKKKRFSHLFPFSFLLAFRHLKAPAGCPRHRRPWPTRTRRERRRRTPPWRRPTRSPA